MKEKTDITLEDIQAWCEESENNFESTMDYLIMLAEKVLERQLAGNKA